MLPLSAERILQVWEAGWSGLWMERVLATLAAALPGSSRDELGALSVGECNILLGRARARTFGSRLEGFASCASCGERLEFSMDLAGLVSGPPLTSREIEAEVDGYVVRARAVEVRDLGGASQCSDLASARRLLVEGCVLSAAEGDHPISAALLPESVIARVAERLAELDPHAEVRLQLHCPSCRSAWTTSLDLVDFFWTEIGVYARRMLREVHALARAYGWSEASILEMSPARRAAYLAMIGE